MPVILAHQHAGSLRSPACRQAEAKPERAELLFVLSGPVGGARGGLLDALALHHGEEARGAVATLLLRLEAWLVFGAVCLRARAAGVEGAPLRRGCPGGGVGRGDDPLGLARR